LGFVDVTLAAREPVGCERTIANTIIMMPTMIGEQTSRTASKKTPAIAAGTEPMASTISRRVS